MLRCSRAHSTSPPVNPCNVSSVERLQVAHFTIAFHLDETRPLIQKEFLLFYYSGSR